MKRVTLPLVIALFAASMSATPFHDKPKWYVAAVTGPSVNELYGPFRSESGAVKFCANIPKMYRCEAHPIQPPVEWMRKGAR